MKNIKNFKIEYLEHITIIHQLELESIKLMIQEHYNNESFDDTLFIINLIDLEIDLDYFKQHRKIYYNLEHAKDLVSSNHKYVLEQYRKLGITEVWSMEPNCEMFDSDMGIKFMPVRYCALFDKNVIKSNSRTTFDLGFAGIVGSKYSPKRNDFLDKQSDPKYNFSFKIMNGYNISSMRDEFTNCKFAFDFHRTYKHNNQNQVRIFEHLCLGHTVLSEKSEYNMFPGLIYEWEDIDELNELINKVEPHDFSEEYKEMTYRDEDYEYYRNQILNNKYYNQTLEYFDACGIKKHELMNKLISKLNYESYLEIGLFNGETFNVVNCENKTRVDAQQGEYFEQLPDDTKFDLIFIDGLHLWEQCYKDINNSLKHLSPNGIIICHDMNPMEEMYQTRKFGDYSLWNGDVWKAFVKIRSERNDIYTCMIEDCDFGLGVITWGTQEPIKIGKPIDELYYYDDFIKNKAYLMNTIKIDDFIKYNQL